MGEFWVKNNGKKRSLEDKLKGSFKKYNKVAKYLQCIEQF